MLKGIWSTDITGITHICVWTLVSCCIYAYFSADDLWSQRAVIKWPESGSSRQSVSSSLFVHHSQTGSECWGLDSKEQQQARPFRPRRRVGCYSDEKFQSTNMFLVQVYLFSAHGFQYFRVAADALQILLARAQLDEVLKRLDEDKAWDSMKETNTHITGVTLLAR